jgi:hypothetical protein
MGKREWGKKERRTKKEKRRGSGEWGKKERRTKNEKRRGSREWGGYIEFIPGWGLWLMGVRVGGG